MKYFVSVNGREYVVEVDGERVVVDGTPAVAHLLPIPGTPLRQLVLDDRPLVLPMERDGDGWQLTVHGERIVAEAVDERTRHIRSLIATSGEKAGGGVIKAPMPGLVVRVPVAPGDFVRAGQGVVVLEAMKMENELKAPADGTVKAVLVEPGQAVQKGQGLVEVGG